MNDEIDEDRAVLDRLAADGHDLTRPMAIDFFAVAGSEDSAHAIAESLRESDIEGEVVVAEDDAWDEEMEGSTGDGPDGDDVVLWEVCLTVQMIPMLERIKELEARVASIATDHDGSGDGWGTEGNVTIDIDTDES